MIAQPTPLAGSFVIDVERKEDERGFFARTFCRREFAALGLRTEWVQSSVSFNRLAGTLRGMHLAAPPHAETKLVRCTMGAIFDVIVDVRPASPTFSRWFAVELTAENRRAVYLPEGFAHGFQTLTDNTEVFYEISAFYEPHSACGFRWDDQAVGIDWPAADRRIISERDRTLPLLKDMQI